MTKEEVRNIYNLLTSDNLQTALRIILDLEPKDFAFCMNELIHNLSVRTYAGGHFIYIKAGWFFLNTNKQKFKRQNDSFIKKLL
jgi:hypothetical protein